MGGDAPTAGSQGALEEGHEACHGDGHRLGFVVEVVVGPTFGHDNVLVGGGGAAVDLPTIPIGPKAPRLVADDHHQRLDQHLGMEEGIPPPWRRR